MAAAKADSSKSAALKSLLRKAYLQRWDEVRWSIQIKEILPRGTSGDVHDLAGCIFKYAFVAKMPNMIFMPFLKHSLCTHLVSHAAVLRAVIDYRSFGYTLCIEEILDLLDLVRLGLTCRTDPEEDNIGPTCLKLVEWLLECYLHNLNDNPTRDCLTYQPVEILPKIADLLKKYLDSEYFFSIICCAKYEGDKVYPNIVKLCKDIKMEHQKGLIRAPESIEKILDKASTLKIVYAGAVFDKEAIVSCSLESLIVQHFFHPKTSNDHYIGHLGALQKMKNYPNAKLYGELIRVCMVSLQDSVDSPAEFDWLAFIVLKLPKIITGYHYKRRHPRSDEKIRSKNEITEAFDLLANYKMLLENVDAICGKSFFQVLSRQFFMLRLIPEKQAEKIIKKRANGTKNTKESTKVDMILAMNHSVEQILTSINQTLKKSREKPHTVLELVNVFNQLVNSFELMLAVVSAEEKMKRFVTELLELNEYTKRGSDMPCNAYSEKYVQLFEISFLMLLYIVQKYGQSFAETESSKDSYFFVKFVKEFMPFEDNLKNPEQLSKSFNTMSIDRLHMQITSGQSHQLNSGNGNWFVTAAAAAGVVELFLQAWNSNSIRPQEVSEYLNNLRSSSCCLSIFASAWLCAHMSVTDQPLKPMNMIRKFIEPITNDSFEKKTMLTSRIIKKFLKGVVHSSTASGFPPPNGKSKIPFQTQLKKILEKVFEVGRIKFSEAKEIKELFKIGGTSLFCTKIVEELLLMTSQEEIIAALDLIYAIMHIDIEKCTLELIRNIIPKYLTDISLGRQFSSLQTLSLIKLTVFCIFSFLKFRKENLKNIKVEPAQNGNNRKRPREEDDLDDLESPEVKIAKLHGFSDFDAAVFKVPQNPPWTPQKSATRLAAQSNDPQSNLTELFDLMKILTDEYGNETKLFVISFLKHIITCGGDNSKLILSCMPESMTINLIKALPKSFSGDFIYLLYDAKTEAGRKLIIRDLSLLQNIRLRSGTLV